VPPETNAAEYDSQIAVHKTAPDTYAATLDDGWMIAAALNGGYLLSVLGNAIRTRLAEEGERWPHPFVISAYYMTAGAPGPAEVRTQLKRVGGSVATVAAELFQGDTLRMTALATFGDLAGVADDIATTAEEPAFPPPEECFGREDGGPGQMPEFFNRFDMRFPADLVGWALGQPGEKAEIGAWMRLHDREPDPLSLLLYADALPPVTIALGKWGWAPTLELTVHVRALPAPGWVKVRQVSRNMAGGMFEEDCEIWDSSGRLVAQARQLARQPRPDSSVV